MHKFKQNAYRLFRFLGKLILLFFFNASLLLIVEALMKNNIIWLKSLIATVFLIISIIVLFKRVKNSDKKYDIKLRVQKSVTYIMIIIALYLPIMLIGYHFTISDYIPVKMGYSDNAILKDKRVLIISPHQDDEVNIAAGTIESFTDAGSEVYVIYLTSGDYLDLADVRQQESINAMALAGVPEENLIFLGYGDRWQDQHIYNRQGDEIAVSHNNHTKTYASTNHPDFATQYRGAPSDYTRNNIIADLVDSISLVNPDIIICSDYDLHPDHRATSLLFEEAMGKMLVQKPSWKPIVLKSICYYSRWKAPDDFYNLPLLETKEPEGGMYPLGTPSYRWEERIRLPMPNQFLTYKAQKNEFNKLYRCYDSQDAVKKLGQAVNSDEVFFERTTDSVLYGKTITASSGKAEVLNDFKLFDTSNIERNLFDEGCWIPSDNEKSIRCEFDEPQTLNSVTLWDNPDKDANVLGAVLTLSDGTTIEIGALDPYGAKNQIIFDTRDNISWFELKLTNTQGLAGLTELELANKGDIQPKFIKIMDDNSNFIYNSPISVGQSNSFMIYSWGEMSDKQSFDVEISQIDGQYSESYDNIDASNLKITVDNEGIYRLRVRLSTNSDLYDECILYTPNCKPNTFFINNFERDCEQINNNFIKCSTFASYIFG